MEYDILAARRRTMAAAAQRSAAHALANVSDKSENMQKLLAAITQKQTAAPDAFGTGRHEQKYSPLEQQFVELARISTAKDSIIEQQRADIKLANETLEQKERSLRNMQEDLSKMMKSFSAKEEELSLMRSLGKDQAFVCDKMDELTKKLVESEKIIAAQRKEIEFLVRKIAKLDDDRILAQKLGTSSESATESTTGPLGLYWEREWTQADQKEGEMSYVELMDALGRARARNEMLENEAIMADEKYQQLNEVYAAVVAENTKLMARLGCSKLQFMHIRN
ncbi:unnamed protein product [Gongylonema pulchrum]|uniref:Uncharacterized protein n=1 Tax=Gongylonema pulchrum TaxID=637853 RepID=A0A3P7NZ64_9BILA|nr:unnamed protein product [Gongylonema pulchrum]